MSNPKYDGLNAITGTVTAVCAALTLWTVYVQLPFVAKPQLSYYLVQSNQLASKKTGACEGRVVVTIQNKSIYAAQDVHISLRPISQSKITADCDYGITEVSSATETKVYLIKTVPPRKAVTITFSQPASSFPRTEWTDWSDVFGGGEEPEPPKKYSYRYCPEVLRVFTNTEDVVKLDQLCKDFFELVDDDYRKGMPPPLK